MVSREEELALLREQASATRQVAMNRLPVDACLYPELNVNERLALHATHGISRRCALHTLPCMPPPLLPHAACLHLCCSIPLACSPSLPPLNCSPPCPVPLEILSVAFLALLSRLPSTLPFSALFPLSLCFPHHHSCLLPRDYPPRYPCISLPFLKPLHFHPRSSLRHALVQMSHAGGLSTEVVRCLCEASALDNVASAREIVRTAAPQLLQPLLVRSPDGIGFTINAAAALVSGGGGKETAEQRAVSFCVQSMVDSITALQRACTAQVSSQPPPSHQLRSNQSHFPPPPTIPTPPLEEPISPLPSAIRPPLRPGRPYSPTSPLSLPLPSPPQCSQGMLVALGAQITILEFVAGRTARRLEAACEWLQDWIWKAEQGPCSYIFRMSSWLEARQVHQ